MRKLMVPILLLIFVVCGCSSGRTSGDVKSLGFSKGNVTLGMSISEVKNVLGEGEEKSKGIYLFGETTVMLINDKVIFVLTTDKDAVTNKGIKVGDKAKRITKVYGSDATLMSKNDGSNFYEVMYKNQDGQVTVTTEKPYDYYLGMNVENDKVIKLVISDNTAFKLPM